VRCCVIIVQELPGEDRFDPPPFAHPIPLNVAALRRLSFATVDPASGIVVDSGGTVLNVIGFGAERSTLAYFYVLGIYKRPCEYGRML
jgi:hypothetical protein